MDAAKRGKRHIVATAEEIAPGARKIVTIGGREIGVFNLNGQYYALRNVCPHKGAPLCKGRQRPLMVAADDFDIRYEREDEILKCPWHLWEFDIKTGRSMHDENLRAQSYRVSQEDDGIVLCLD